MTSTLKKHQYYRPSRPIFLMRRIPTNANLYHYGGNNPVTYVDPTGRADEDDIASSLGDISKHKGADINLFPAEREEDVVDTSDSGEKIYIRNIAEKAERYKNLFYVAAHGNRGIVSSWGNDGKGSKEYLSPSQLAKKIKNHPNYHNQPIVLWICNAGNDPNNEQNDWNCYAQQLADCIGQDSTVIANQEYVPFHCCPINLEKSF